MGGPSCSPSWIPTFGGLPGVYGEVKDCVTFDAGTGPELYVGGHFWLAGGTGAVNVAHWNGSRWESTGSVPSYAPNNTVLTLAVLEPEGGSPVLLAAGDEEFDRGTIVQWDGSSWTTFAATNGRVNVLITGADGTLYAGGEFTSIGGVQARHVARFNGSAWEALGIGRPGAINDLVLHDDGTGTALYAASASVAKWNGSSWQVLGGPVGPALSTVSDLETFDGNLYAKGGFTIIGGVPAEDIARWNGLAWSALPPLPLGDIGAELSVFDDGGGPALYTTAYLGELDESLARFDGSAWTLVGGPTPYDVYRLHAFDDLGPSSGLFGSGTFDFLAGEPGQPASRIARFDGSAWSALGDGASRTVGPVAEHVDAGTKRLAGVVGPFGKTYVATWDESEWVPLGSGTFNAPVETLESIDLGSGPTLYAGGQFTQLGSLVARVVRWTPAGWENVGNGLNSTVRALVGHDDGTGLSLYAAGLFSLGGGQWSGVMRWNGVAWSPLGSGWNNEVTALGTFDDGNGPALYAGGFFSIAGGVAADGIARWNGSTWSALGSGLRGVRALAVFDDGSGPALYAGGAFQIAGGAVIKHIARWDGTTWSAVGSLGSLNHHVYDLATFDDGTGPALFAGGDFTQADGMTARRVAKWNGVEWSPLGSGLHPASFLDIVMGMWLAVVGDGASAALHAAGDFYSPDSRDSYVVRWACAPPDETPPVLSCPTDAAALDRFPDGLGEVVHFFVSAVDELDPAPELVCTPPSGSVFPVGTTMVTCTATDASGNESTCEFPVTVQPKARRR